MTLIDLTGKRYGRITVISQTENSKSGITQWVCECDCGRTFVSRGDSLRNGRTKSCGCLKRDRTIERNYRHGDAYNRLYNVWRGMKQRVYDENHISYKYYGGRGIGICEEWASSYEAFRSWAFSNGYNEDAPRGSCTLDRIDVNGDYKPDNCRWVSMKVQQNNHRPKTT